MGEVNKLELGGDREALISNRLRILEELEVAEKAVFFGPAGFPAGSHEYTEEGFNAAQGNDQLKKDLRGRLREVNKKLGLEENSRERLQ